MPLGAARPRVYEEEEGLVSLGPPRTLEVVMRMGNEVMERRNVCLPTKKEKNKRILLTLLNNSGRIFMNVASKCTW